MSEVALREGLYGFEFKDVDNRRAESLEDRKTYQCKQLWQRHHEMASLLVKGYNYSQVAEILNVHPSTVSNFANSELGMLKVSELRKERDEEARKTSEKIRVLRDKALNVYHEIFENETIPIMDKKKVADTIVLELSGLKVPTRVETASVHLTKSELDELKKRGVESARDMGILIPEDVPEAEIERTDNE